MTQSNAFKVLILAYKPLTHSRRVGLFADFFTQNDCKTSVHCLQPDPRFEHNSDITFHVHSDIGVFERLVDKAFRIGGSGAFKTDKTGIMRVLNSIVTAALILPIKVVNSVSKLVAISSPKVYARLKNKISSLYYKRRRISRVNQFNKSCLKHIRREGEEYDLIVCHDIYPVKATQYISQSYNVPIWFDVVDHISNRSFMLNNSHSRFESFSKPASELLNQSDLVVLNGNYRPELDANIKREVVLNANPSQVNLSLDKVQLTKKLEVQVKRFVIAGTHFESSGIHRAIEFVEAYDDAAQLDIIGFFPDADYKQNLLKKVTSQGLEKRVRFFDRQSPKALLNLISQVDAVIMPFDPMHENLKQILPNRLFDALSAGTPVLAQSGTATANWVDKYKFGVSVDFFDIEKSVNDFRRYDNKPAPLSFETINRLRKEFVWEEQVKKLAKHLLRIQHEP